MKNIIIFLICLSFSNAVACLWDRDTIRDELQTKTSAYDLVVGQSPHHGQFYYKKRIENIEEIEDLNFDQKQDLAVAYIRLGDFLKAEELLKNLYGDYTNTYSVNSNLGVLYKKKGDYEKAYIFMKRALKIKPQGHMGLGDWYLKRIDYDRKLNGGIPDVNFLGEKYSEINLKFASRKQLDQKRKH